MNFTEGTGIAGIALIAVSLVFTWWIRRVSATVDALQAELAALRKGLADQERALASLHALAAQVRLVEQRLASAPAAPTGHDKEQITALRRGLEALEEKLFSLQQAASAEAAGSAGPGAGAAEPAAPVLPGWLFRPGEDSDPDMPALRLLGGAEAAPRFERWLERCDRERAVWARGPSDATRLAGLLRELSQELLAILRDAGAGELDAILVAEWFLKLLRRLWSGASSTLHVRGCFPGMPFDPEWMELPQGRAARSPVVGACLAFGVFDRVKGSEYLVLKAVVTTS
jgi:hypothetical protein